VGEGRVIAGQHGDLFTFLLETLQSGQGDGWHEKFLIQALWKLLRVTRVILR
jgi:hypothetical protein